MDDLEQVETQTAQPRLKDQGSLGSPAGIGNQIELASRDMFTPSGVATGFIY